MLSATHLASHRLSFALEASWPVQLPSLLVDHEEEFLAVVSNEIHDRDSANGPRRRLEHPQK